MCELGEELSATEEVELEAHLALLRAHIRAARPDVVAAEELARHAVDAYPKTDYVERAAEASLTLAEIPGAKDRRQGCRLRGAHLVRAIGQHRRDRAGAVAPRRVGRSVDEGNEPVARAGAVLRVGPIPLAQEALLDPRLQRPHDHKQHGHSKSGWRQRQGDPGEHESCACVDRVPDDRIRPCLDERRGVARSGIRRQRHPECTNSTPNDKQTGEEQYDADALQPPASRIGPALPEEADHDDGSDQYELEDDPAPSPGA